MKPVYYSLFRIALATLSLVIAGSASSHAQIPSSCRTEEDEIPWVLPPSIAAVDGSGESGSPGIVYTAERNNGAGIGGPIQVWNLALGNLEQNRTLTPGVELPAGITDIWDIRTVGEDKVFALISYTERDTSWYGFLRSMDGGEEWELIKPAALQIPHFHGVEGKIYALPREFGGFYDVDYTGNYWRAPLYEMEWLDDGMHGWAWGRSGIVRTTDGGATWSVAYEAQVSNTQIISDNRPVWGLAFKSPDSGSAVIGAPVGSSFRMTTDGGETWTTGTNLTVNRLADLQYIDGEYRAIAFNRTIRSSNTYMYVSADGQAYNTRGNINSKILTESVYATEAVWETRETGYVTQRQGELWRTDDAGLTWTMIQATDDEYDTVLFGDGTAINGMGSGPRFPYAGYGQRTVSVTDDFGEPYLLNVISDICKGDMRPNIAQWRVDLPTSVSDKGTSVSALSLTPNPARDRCEVRFALESGSPVTALLVDTRGVVLKRVDFGRLSAGTYEKTIGLDGVPSGTYRLVVRSDEGQRTEGIVVQK